MRKYGVSVISLLPWSFLGLKFSIDMALEAGFDGIQELPLHFRHYERGYSELEPWVISVEGAWNYGSFLQMVGRTLGRLPDPAPTYKDFLLFGQKNPPVFPAAITSRHIFTGPLGFKHVTEIHPELSTQPDDYLGYAQVGGKLTWDTTHVIRPHRETGVKFEDWRQLLEVLPADSIGLVHFQPPDVAKFLNGDSVQIEMLLALNDKIGPDVPVIVEVPNVWKTRAGTVQHLNLILENLQLYI